MAKSKARFLSELLGTTGLVKKSKSALAGADEVIDLSTLPSIPNSKLTNSSISIAGHSTALGSSVSLNTGNITEHTNYLYYTDARADARIAAADTGDLSEGSNLYYTNARADARVNLQTGSNLDLSSKSTGDLSEGSNLYYTNARADARIAAASTSDLSEGTNLYYTDARADARVALIVDSAPGTLNTLNELAAALGDDANFSTTVTNSIATKLPLAGGTMTGTLIVDAGSSGMIDFGNVTTAYGRLYADNSGTFIGSKSNHPLILRSNHTTALTLDTSQNATFAGTISSGAITSSGVQTFTKSVYGDFSTENFFRIKFQDQGGITNDVGIGQFQSGAMGFNVTQGQQFRFNEGTDGEIARIGPNGVDARQGGFRISGTTVIDASRNLTNIGTISSGAITSSGDISANSGKVRMGNPTLLSGRSSIRIDSDGDSFADLVFGDNVTSTSWANGNWAISSRSSSESNSLKIYRGSGQPSPYNSEHVLMEFKQNNVVSVNSTLQINNNTVIDASRNLTNIGTISSGAITSTGILTLDTSPAANGTGDLVVIPSLSSSAGVGFAGQVFGVNVKNAVHSTHNTPQVSSTWGGVTGATAIAIQADDNTYGQFQVWTAPQDSSADDLLTPKFYIAGSGNATFTGTLSSGAITTNNNFNMTGGYSVYLGSTSRFSSDNNGSFGINYGTTGGTATGSLVIYNNTTATSQLNRNGTIASNISGNNTVGGNIVLGPTSGSSKWYAITGRQYDSGTETEGYSLITGATSSGVNDVTIGGGLDEQNAATKVMIKAAANSTTRNGTEVVRVTTDGLDVRNNVVRITGTTVIDASRNLTNIGTISSGAITSTGQLVVDTDTEHQIKIDASSSSGASMHLNTAGGYAYTVYQNSNRIWRIGAYGGSSFTIRDHTGSANSLVIDSSSNATFSGTISSGVLDVEGAAGGSNLAYASNFAASGAGIQLTLERTSNATGWGGIGADATYCFAAWGGSGGVTRRFAIGQSGNANLLYGGYQINGTTVIDSSRVLQNVTLGHSNAGARFETNDWMYDTGNKARFYFEGGGRTFYGSDSGHQFRDSGDTTRFNINNYGGINLLSGGDGQVASNVALAVGGTTVIDSSRNLTNINTATLSSTTNMLLTLNPTAGNYGGIVFQYGGATKGTSIYNSGMMVYGGESGVSTSLQAGGQYGLFIHHNTRNVGIGTGTSAPSYKLQVTGTLGVSGTTTLADLIIGTQLNFNGATNSSFIGAASTVNIRYAADGYHRFDTYNGGWGERVQITDTGCHPATDNTYDLGTTLLRWRNVYTTDLHLSNEGKPEGNEVDGTTGNWTIQEGAENLYILNNKTGKKYKFALEEIT